MGKIFGLIFGAMLVPRFFWIGGILGFILGAYFDKALQRNLKVRFYTNMNQKNADAFSAFFQEQARAQASFQQKTESIPDDAQQNPLKAAYDMLGIVASVSDAEVKKAYRKLMSQYHPDKLESKDLPPDLLQMAKEKTQSIRAAYETIAAARGIKV